MRKGQRQSPESRERIAEAARLRWKQPGFRDRVSAKMRQLHIEQASRWRGWKHSREARAKMAKARGEPVFERFDRIQLFSIAAELESGACRLQMAGMESRAEEVFAIVRELRTTAAKL
jgi:hypothetical protein